MAVLNKLTWLLYLLAYHHSPLHLVRKERHFHRFCVCVFVLLDGSCTERQTLLGLLCKQICSRTLSSLPVCYPGSALPAHTQKPGSMEACLLSDVCRHQRQTPTCIYNKPLCLPCVSFWIFTISTLGRRYSVVTLQLSTYTAPLGGTLGAAIKPWTELSKRRKLLLPSSAFCRP